MAPSSVPTLVPSLNPSSTPSECIDEPGWFFARDRGGEKLGCDALSSNPERLCAAAELIELSSKPASFACCVSFSNLTCFIIKLKESLTL